MTPTAIKLIIKLWNDDCPECPNDYDGWKAYSFSSRHGNSKDPDEVGFEEDEDGNHLPDKELQAKLDSGLAFMLDYYEHGLCSWSLAGAGPQCRWDTSRMAGLLVWEDEEDAIGAKTPEDRRGDATAFINRFTQWCNGQVYGYTIEAFSKCHACGQDETAEVDFDLPSCGGYYLDDADDVKGMIVDMKDHIGTDWADYEVKFEEQHGYGIADEVKRLWKGE